jgi:hypothetical protein
LVFFPKSGRVAISKFAGKTLSAINKIRIYPKEGGRNTRGTVTGQQLPGYNNILSHTISISITSQTT